MLKRLLCAVFLTMFCFGNVAYGMSNEAVRKKLETTLRREIGPIIDYGVRESCRDAGLKVPDSITLEVPNFNAEGCFIFIGFSSHVPEKMVENIAGVLCSATAFYLRKDGVSTDGMLIVVQPCDTGKDISFYDAQTVLHTHGGEAIEKTIPKEDAEKILMESIRKN